MIVWLWDAGNAKGVTDDESRARGAAEACLRDGAVTARIDKAVADLGIRAMASGYQRTGEAWEARCRENRITWTAVPGFSHAEVSPWSA